MEAVKPDLDTMNDPDFLAHQRTVREQLAEKPGDPDLVCELLRCRAEFDRRAKAAWDATW